MVALLPLPVLFPVLLALLLPQRAWTLSAPASGRRPAFLPTPAPSSSSSSSSSGGGSHRPNPTSTGGMDAPVTITSKQPLPLSRRGRARGQSGSSSSSSSRRHALPPFDTPLDPATIEAMASQAASAAAEASAGMGPAAVTTEQLWVGFVAGVFPFAWAGYEFWKRIDTQQRCGVCQGSGLVYASKSGRTLEIPRKCYACGGFLPWMGWRRFWLSNLDIGNGGILQRPAPDYEALSAEAKEKRRQEAGSSEE